MFFMYIECFKILSAKYCQKDKKKSLKKLAIGIKIFLRKRKTKTKNVNMVVNDIKISQKKKIKD